MKKIAIILLISCSCVFSVENTASYNELIAPIKKTKMVETKSPIFDGNMEPNFPDDYGNNKTIIGIDSNGDGVRDDIEIFINRKANNRNERLALKQYAKYSNLELEKWNKVSVEELYSINKSIRKAEDCFLYITNNKTSSELITSIDDLIYGNTERDEASKAIGFKLRGMALGSGVSINESYKCCEFKVDNLDEIIKAYQPKKE
jgi:hypothetical protein